MYKKINKILTIGFIGLLSIIFSYNAYAGTIVEKDKIIVSNDFVVVSNTVLNNVEADGTFKKILKIGNTTTIPEKLYQWVTNAWVVTIDTNGNCTKMLGIAIGTNSSINGMLVNGDLTVTNTNLSPGSPIYVSSASGEWGHTIPTNSGEIIRIIGYAIETNKIHFSPDGIWGAIQ
jgi:hypothetical protein